MPDIANIASAKKANIFCLLVAIVITLVLPLRKEIWYDETVSILCSKGISHETPAQFANATAINSATLNDLNTPKNVFNATVVDNGNGFLYNIGLHWFTGLFGNTLTIYTLFTQACGIVALIAFFALCTLLFGNSIFTALAILLFAADNVFMGMAHEIRGYTMGVAFVILAAIYFYKFTYQNPRPFHLFLTGMFSVAAILSHFLSVYVILVFLAAILYAQRGRLLSWRNIGALILPICILGAFFYFAYSGLQTMGMQNHEIQAKNMNAGFNLPEVFFRSLKFTDLNFKAMFPAFVDNKVVYVISFLFVIALYLFAVKATADKVKKRNLQLLLLLGGSGTLFLAFLSIKSGHYTALYFRYYSFCIPFSCLFMAYTMYVVCNSPSINQFIKAAIPAFIIVPTLLFFVLANRVRPDVQYNHHQVATEILRDNVTRMGVPRWRDAFLVQAFLPGRYKIDYELNPNDPNFTLYKTNTVEKIPVIKGDL